MSSIIADNGFDDCFTELAVISISHSLVGDGSCGVISGVNGNLAGDPYTLLDGLTYLVISDDAGGSNGSGVIEATQTLTGQIPAVGYFLVA